MATLLYVDDERTIGIAVSRWFARRGHVVHLASTIAEGQRAMTDHDPDIIFLDVWLGSESGFELMGWIEDVRPHLANRVTFVTGELAETSTSDRLYRTLGRPVLQKPFDFAQLEEIIGKASGEALGLVRPDAEQRAGT
jgi:two-component system nitrogen regulation response regulator NtrX